MSTTQSGKPPQLEEHRFYVTGMSCASCVSHVEEFLKEIPGVIDVAVNLATEEARVQSQVGQVTGTMIEKAVAEAGYEAHFPTPHATVPREEQKDQELRRDRMLLYVATILTIPLVFPMLAHPFGFTWSLPGAVQWALATPLQFGLGARFYRAGFKGLKAGFGTMDLLVAMGTSAAYGLSVYLLMGSSPGHGGDHLYFESAAVIITLIRLGKYGEARAKRQTANAIRALQALTPETAHVEEGGEVREVSLAAVRVGQVVLVRPGERIPVDGMMIEGRTAVDEALITGESLPRLKEVGDSVTGGAINGEGFIKVKTTAIGAETTLARMIRMVENAQIAKAPIQRLVDRISGVFVPVVVGIALLTLLGWGFGTGNWEMAIINGVSVLVIACPCALGLATPTSIMVGTGLAARSGILIKDADALEVAHSVTTVVFDKTGTLTEGRPQVIAIQARAEEQVTLGIARSLQIGSEHALARAIISYADLKKVPLKVASSVTAVPGFGISGQVEGHEYILGSLNFMLDRHLGLDDWQEWRHLQEAQGRSIAFLGDMTDHQVVGAFAFSDTIKENAIPTMTALKKLKLKTVMLTGDNQGSADAVGAQLGIEEVRANVLPQEKSTAIEELKHRGDVVAMVGDGINDAPALAAADVGMAMSTGTDVAMESAGITLMRGNPLLIPDAIEISRRTYGKIKQNLFWAFIYNIIGIPLAAFGFLSPMIAGGAMALSSVSVVSNALLLRRWRPASR